MPLWILAVCAAIATFIYTVDFTWWAVRQLRKEGVDTFLDRLEKIAPKVIELWTSLHTVAPSLSAREMHETNDFAPLSGYFDVRRGSKDGYTCTLTYGFNDDSITVEGYSVLSPALAYFDASQLMVAALQKRGDLPETHHVGPRDATPQDAPGSQEP